MILTTEEFSIEKKFLTIAFSKGKYFGSGIGISPSSIMNDGYIHLTLIGEVNLLQYLRYLPLLKKAKKIVHPEVSYTTAKTARIAGKGNIELDGELVFELPVELQIVPKAVCWIGELR
jgi:diacylglycerol kinase family enzyme